MNSFSHSVALHLLAILLIVAGPAFDPLVVAPLKENCDSRRRVRLYAVSVGMQWVGAGIALGLVGWRGIANAGESVMDAAPTMGHWWVQAPVLIIAAAGILFVFQWLLKSLRKSSIKNAYQNALRRSEYRFLFPTSQAELLWFALVSITAGVCEEVLFRGFLLGYLHSGPFSFALPLSLVLTSIAFGFNHAYQGRREIVQSAVVGLMLGLVFLATGSLVLAMVIHAAIDLQVVFMLAPSGLSEAKLDGVSPNTAPR